MSDQVNLADSMMEHEKMTRLKSLIDHLEVLNKLQSSQIEELILAKIRFLPNGVIDWESYPNSIAVLDFEKTSAKITNKSCYIMWDEGTLPIVKTDLDSIKKNLFDVTRIAFDTWIVGENFEWVFEFHHSGLIHYTEL